MIPYPYVPNMGRVGIHDPSNIVQNPADGYFYFLAGVAGYQAQATGICLVRNKTIDPAGWRAWDGRDFIVQSVDPYAAPNLDPSSHICQSVIAQPVYTFHQSLSFNTLANKFVVTGYLK